VAGSTALIPLMRSSLAFLISWAAVVGGTFAAGLVSTDEARGADGALVLEPGKPRFWMGGHVERGRVSDAALCDIAAPCPAWTLAVAPGGSLLRVGLDTPSREDGFRIDLTDPAGAAAQSADASNQFNAEALVKNPAAGKWTVRVVPTDATEASFRMRAKLETAAPQSAEKRMLLPNLKAVPPYEFGFVAPANPLNGVYPPDTVNPPLSVAGVEPLSCAPDELAPKEAGGQGAIECLRLTTGPINVGDGPFLKLFTFAGDVADGTAALDTLRGPSVQRIQMSDGTHVERPAGTYSFHTTHGHFHDDGILTYELFRVEGERLVAAGVGTKSGFCPADQLIGEWRRFAQDAPSLFSSGDTVTGCVSPVDGALSLTRGWGDVYRWQRPGQFMEFAGNGDGLYVARATVDKSNTTLETNEGDNSSYSLIRIAGRRIDLLERGQGQSHLDSAKEVFTGFGPASQDGIGGELLVGGPPVLGGGKDRVAPKVRSVKLVRRGTRLVVRIRLSEAATVKLVALRGTRRLATMTRRAVRGTTVVVLPKRVRGKGVRVAVTARDAAGNYSRTRISRAAAR